MPVYVFGCTACDLEQEILRPLGDQAPPTCPECSEVMRHKVARVAVKYDAWGFTSTDRLVRQPGTGDVKALRSRAEQIADG
jgi:putative FmdB family regulatory protein